MRLNFRYLLITGLLALPACSPTGGGGTPPDSLQLAGKYNGSFIITNSSPFVNVKTTFTVDAAGNLVGTTTPTDASQTDPGTIKGTIQGSSALSLDFNLQFESPAMGKYNLTGKGASSSLTKDLTVQFTAKNTAGTYIGDAPFVSKKE